MERDTVSTKRVMERCMVAALYVLAIYLRSTLFGIHNSDYDGDFSSWYDFIQSHGGFAALKYNFSNYNVPYFYLLTLMTYLPIPKIISIKLIPVCFDVLMAQFVSLVVRLKYKQSSLPTIASLVVLFTPTVFILSGLWGQFESIYASLSIGGLYFLLRKQPWWAFVFFGLAISFKPQALFLFPLLFVLLITGELPKKYVLIIPAVYLITMLPACSLGRNFIDLLTTYRSREDNPGHLLTRNAPTIFQWLPTGPFEPWDTAGFVLALSAVGILSFVVLTSRRKITNEIMLKLALVFVILVPFLMPEMHERYFYLADIISLIYAFYFTKRFYVPIIVQIFSLISYTAYISTDFTAVIDLKYMTLLVLGVIIITILDLVQTLFSTNDAPSSETQAIAQDAPLGESSKAQKTGEDAVSDSISFEPSISWYGSLFGSYKEGLRKMYHISSKKTIARFLPDILVVGLLAGLLLYGVFVDQPWDPMIYQCDAVAFWHGWLGFQMSPGLSEQCGFLANPNQDLTVISRDGILHALQQWRLPSGLLQFVAAQSPDLPYHGLPKEYPLLALLPFSLGLLTPADWYRAAFALWMALFAAGIYLTLRFYRSRGAALAASLYMVVGGWRTAAGCFDIVPAALTLFAVTCAERKRWNWAFALLALATLSKLYPAILLVPFVLALQQETPGTWYAWRRWQPVGVFVGICVLVIGVSLLFSVAGTLAPLGFFIDRPVQLESLSASLLWIASVLWKTPLTYAEAFGSRNAISPFSSSVTLLMNIVLVVGLFSTWWQQWRRCIGLAMACLLTLLLVLITGKVFSTQYLIWVLPLAAYVGQRNRRWLLFWMLVGFLTTFIYICQVKAPPYAFLDPYTPFFNTVLAVRNLLLLTFFFSMLISGSLFSHPLSPDEEQTESGEQGASGQKESMKRCEHKQREIRYCPFPEEI
jgi:Gpi18-like mannosyltransferase